MKIEYVPRCHLCDTNFPSLKGFNVPVVRVEELRKAINKDLINCKFGCGAQLEPMEMCHSCKGKAEFLASLPEGV